MKHLLAVSVFISSVVIVQDKPLYFIEGNGDQQKSHDIVEDYYKFLKAQKKAQLWFEKSGHTVFNSEPEKLQKVIIEHILPTLFKYEFLIFKSAMHL